MGQVVYLENTRDFPVDFNGEFIEDFRDMWVIRRIVLIIVIIYIFGPGFVWGQKFIVQSNGGVVFSKEGNIDEAFSFGFGLSYSITQKIRISFELGYWKSDVKEGPEKLYKGKLSATPFLASIHYVALKKRKFTPYIFIGFGYILYDFWLGDIITIPEITITQKVENGPALFGGLGGQAQAWNRISLFAETLYFYSKPDGKTIISDMNFGDYKEEFSLDMRALIIRIGVKYQF